MSTMTYFRARPDYGMGRAFMLAFAVHAVLLAVMFIGVRMQNRPADTVSVELWDPPPPPPAPVVEEKPPPKVEPPKPEPEPEVKKPDIAEKAPPPKPKPKPKPEAKKDEELQKSLIREQIALEQRKLNEERRRIDDVRRKAEAERTARELAATARNRALGDYVNRIRAKVRQHWILPQDVQGNPEAIFNVVQLPTGEVLSVKLKKSSGNPALDAAIERAILKSSPLPLPEPRSLFDRQLELTFRPLD
jgi:colicin import membrane protein